MEIWLRIHFNILKRAGDLNSPCSQGINILFGDGVGEEDNRAANKQILKRFRV